MNHAPCARSIARPVDQRTTTVPLKPPRMQYIFIIYFFFQNSFILHSLERETVHVPLQWLIPHRFERDSNLRSSTFRFRALPLLRAPTKTWTLIYLLYNQVDFPEPSVIPASIQKFMKAKNLEVKSVGPSYNLAILLGLQAAWDYFALLRWSSRSTVVGHWTTCQQLERSILQLGHVY